MRYKKRGSSYIFVIVMVVFLVVMATGFYYMSSYNVVSTVENRMDTQGDILSRSLHSALCKKAADGKLSVMNKLVQKGKEDYEAYLEELEEYRENDEEGDVPEEPDPDSEYQAQSDWTMVRLDNSLYEEAWMKSEVTCKPFRGTAVITTHVRYRVTDVRGEDAEYFYDLASDMTYGQQMEIVTRDPITGGGGESGEPGYAVGITGEHFEISSGGGDFEWDVEPATEGMNILFGNRFTIPWGTVMKSSIYANGDVTIYGPVGEIEQNGKNIEIKCPGNVYCVGGDVKGDIVGGYNGWIAGDVYAKVQDGKGGNIRLTQGPDIIGSVYADGDIGSEIYRADCVWAGGSIRFGNYGIHRFQSVEAVGDIDIYNLVLLEQENSSVPDEHRGKVISRDGSVKITNQQVWEKLADEVRAKHDITISGGNVGGDVIAEDGTVFLDSCTVEGNIYARSVVIRGNTVVNGNIVAEESVDMSQWAMVSVLGDISCGSLKIQGNNMEFQGTVEVAGDASMDGTFYLNQPVLIAGRLTFDGWASFYGSADIKARSISGQKPDPGPGSSITEDPGISVEIPVINRTVPDTAPIPDCPVSKPSVPADQKADFSSFEEAACSLSGSGTSPATLNVEAPAGKNVVYHLPDKYIKLGKVSVPEGQIVYLDLDAMDGKTLYMPANNGNKNKIEGTLILYSSKNVTVKFNGSGKCTMNAQIYLPDGNVIVGNDNWQKLNQEFTGTITAKNLNVINGASFVVTPLPQSFGNTGLGFGEGGGSGGGASYPFPSVGVVPGGKSGWGITRLYRPESEQENGK